jgi:hypothetical protein
VITLLLAVNFFTIAYAFSKSLEAQGANARLSRALGESGKVDWN